MFCSWQLPAAALEVALASPTAADSGAVSRGLPLPEVQRSDGAAAGGAPAAAHTPPHGELGWAAPQRVDVTQWLTNDETHQWGLVLGLRAPQGDRLSAQRGGNVSALDLGLRWRSRLDATRHLDVSAWAVAPEPADFEHGVQRALGTVWGRNGPTAYNTRVEVQWASSRTRGLVPEWGAVGVQLQSGSRLVLRARKGGPMLYYRAKF